MRLDLPRTRARLSAGVLMATCVAASAVLAGQHATPAEAAPHMATVADRIPAQDTAKVSELLAGAKPAAVAKADKAPASAPVQLSGVPGAAKPAVTASAAAQPTTLLGAPTAEEKKAAADKKAADEKKAADAKAAEAKKAADAKAAEAKKAAAPAAKTYANNLDGWIAEARDILAAHGDQVPSAASIHARALTESSGNPKAENHWDGNQALYGGTYGLIQTIKPTFAAYSLPGHKDILNPVDNIIAGVRYANDRYGSFETVAYGKQGY
jgi:hypothetical protein